MVFFAVCEMFGACSDLQHVCSPFYTIGSSPVLQGYCLRDYIISKYPDLSNIYIFQNKKSIYGFVQKEEREVCFIASPPSENGTQTIHGGVSTPVVE
jgi:hypothetical protein